jgi:hypothetical protein
VPPGATNGAGPLGLALVRPPRHPFVRKLADAMLPDLERELLTALKVGVMLADGLPREQVAGKLGISQPELQAAMRRIEQVAERIDCDDETGGRALERHGVTS